MTLIDAHTKFIDSLRASGKANATVIAYGKDIEQLVDFVSKKGKLQSEEVASEDIDEPVEDEQKLAVEETESGSEKAEDDLEKEKSTEGKKAEKVVEETKE